MLCVIHFGSDPYRVFFGLLLGFYADPDRVAAVVVVVVVVVARLYGTHSVPSVVSLSIDLFISFLFPFFLLCFFFSFSL